MTADRPKVMLPIAGKPLLRWLVDGFKKQSINDITVVGGYRADAIDTAGIKLVVNERYARDRRIGFAGLRDRGAGFGYGHLLWRSAVPQLCAARSGGVARQNSRWSWIHSMTGSSNRTVRDFAYCSRGDDRGLFGTPVLLERVTSAADAQTRRRTAAGSAC